MNFLKQFDISRTLHFVFLGLCLAVTVIFFLNLASYTGILSDGPFLRGGVSSIITPATDTLQMAGVNGECRMYQFAHEKLVILDFSDYGSFFRPRHMLYLLLQNLCLGLIIYGLYHLYRIFRNIDHKHIFLEDNIRRIRLIAAAAFVYPISDQEAKMQFTGIVSRIPSHGLQMMSVNWSELIENLLMGGLISLAIFAFAEIFRAGFHLQQEQDLTI